MPEHLGVLDRHFELGSLRPMVRMGLVATQLTRDASFTSVDVAGNGYGAVERLGHRDTGDIMELFAHYPDSFFEPHQLSTGHYCGVRQDSADGPGPLVAVAGIHVASRFERIAALGNIVTHPDHRGRGLSTRVTAHLCQALTAEGIELLALNVERKNASALKVYEKLGFREHCTYLEGFVTRSLARVLDHASEGAQRAAGQDAS
jgi:ribosomal protein S18 acetylase RimI-like enzyme